MIHTLKNLHTEIRHIVLAGLKNTDDLIPLRTMAGSLARYLDVPVMAAVQQLLGRLETCSMSEGTMILLECDQRLSIIRKTLLEAHVNTASEPTPDPIVPWQEVHTNSDYFLFEQTKLRDYPLPDKRKPSWDNSIYYLNEKDYPVFYRDIRWMLYCNQLLEKSKNTIPEYILRSTIYPRMDPYITQIFAHSLRNQQWSSLRLDWVSEQKHPELQNFIQDILGQHTKVKDKSVVALAIEHLDNPEPYSALLTKMSTLKNEILVRAATQKLTRLQMGDSIVSKLSYYWKKKTNCLADWLWICCVRFVKTTQNSNKN